MDIAGNIEVYLDRISETEQACAIKREELRIASDPMVKLTLERTIDRLESLQAIYKKIFDTLVDIRRSDARYEA